MDVRKNNSLRLIPTFSEIAGECFYYECVYVFMTCEEIQNFDVV